MDAARRGRGRKNDREGEPSSTNRDLSLTFDHDWLLDRWLRLAEKGIAVGVTLHIGGLLVSGTLVGAHAYLEHQRQAILPDLLERGLPPPIAHSLDRAFAADLADIAQSEIAERDGPDVPRRFIHLRDAHIITAPGLGAGFPVPYWRGLLHSVDAFFLGTIHPERGA